MSADPRWDRLVATLAARGLDCRLVERRYPGGVSTSIHVDLGAGRRVVIADSWWHDMWTGWQVWSEEADGICTDLLRRSKVRRQVADAVAAAVAA